MELLKEFKPALFFLGKFLALYFASNILYGVFIESHGTAPDAVTRLVSNQTSWLLNRLGYDTSQDDHVEKPLIAL